MSSSTLSSRLLIGTTLVLALLLAACGGGGDSSLAGGGSSASGTDCTHPTAGDVDGCTYVSLGDDTGDFLTYRVKVDKLALTRRDGSVVSLIPAATAVDFAQYTSLDEFLSLNAVPAGDYVSGVITLDFSGANIEAQDSAGNAVSLSPVDSNGKALGSVDVNIMLDSDHPLGLFPGQAHVLGINFDLNASNVINSGSGTVTVQPFLVASVDVASPNTQQVRGPLSSTSSNNFTLGLRPFQAGSGDFGDFVVYVTAGTSFVINKKVSTGATGIAALSAAGKDTAVIAQGRFDFTSHHFLATQVLAGSSVPGGTDDAVEGVVTARNANTLTLRGGSLYRGGANVTFRDTVTVDVGNSTVVRESDKPMQTRNIGNISVGQRLLAFGSFGSASSTTLDATKGFALLRFTAVDGSVLSLVDAGENSSVNLNVDQIENRPIAMFDFTGTSSDPTNYTVHLPCSCLNTGVNIGDPVTVSGFAPAFGTAPPDFNAQALTDFGLADSVISVVWPASGTANAFSSIDPNSGVVPNLSSSPTVQTLREGGQTTSLSSLGSSPAIASKSLGLYAISKGGTVQLYLSFANFVTALNSDLSGGAKVRGFFAVGGFDGPDNLLSATTIAVILD